MRAPEKRFHQNLLIVANAGSGKTHRLVTRCIQLLQRGAKPEHILALTFTRAAAAEFLQKLFERLAHASADARKLGDLQKELVDCPAIDAAGCLQLLRQLIDALPRLSMGTLDQYFGRIVRAFPFELGLSREMELLDDADKEENQTRALEELFARGTDQGLDEFVEILRQQSRNRADQSALNALSTAVTSLQEKFIETPVERGWGNARVIWPASCDILKATDIPTAVARFRSCLAITNPQLSDAAKATLESWLELAGRHRPPLRMNDKLKSFLKKLSDEGLGTAKSALPYFPVGSARVLLPPDMKDARDQLFNAIVKVELESRLVSSQALYNLLEIYELIYDRTVRQAGRVTFTDLIILLAANQQHIRHQSIEYRLDGRYNHWLLDEFQDTSRLQWRVLEPLADEVICDNSGTRSFFYVGDTKQSIYGWRGGDFELFEQVRAHYAADRNHSIAREELSESWRSDKQIINAVNCVFDPVQLRHPDQADFKFPAASIEHWERGWVEHRARAEAAEGFVQFRLLDPADDDETEAEGEDAGQAALDQAVLEILREADPVGRGIQCAIIVRTRVMLEHYVALLRSQENPIPVAAEGRINPCLKSPEGLALLALAKCLATPADLISRQQFLSSPLGFLAGEHYSKFHFEALHSFARDGISATFSRWIRTATGKSLIDPTGVEPFLEATADYDAQRKSGEDVRGLVDFIEYRAQQDSETPGVVRVMTTHFSKGLGMDMVILPELGGKNISEFRDSSGITLHRNDKGAVEWGISLPPEKICAKDETLMEARERIRARQTYENLCVLYVAMTRAKHALYALHVRGRKNRNFGLWLERTFPGGDATNRDCRSLGEANWYRSFAPKKSAGPVIKGHDIRMRAASAAQAAPSAHDGREMAASLVIEGAAARQLGTEVHEMLAQIEWLGDLPDYQRFRPDAADLVKTFLASEHAAFMKKPREPVLLWREKSFDVEIEGRTVTGIFDRVHITLDAQQRPVHASIFDFKTDANPADLDSRYAAQLATYAKAATILLGLEMPQVTTRIIPVSKKTES